MAKNQNKTVENEGDVLAFIHSVDNEKRKKDALKILEIMSEITRLDPKMWGPSIIGFGNYHYKYESGREGDFFKVGFSPRKQNTSLYIMGGFNRYDDLMSKLGKYKTGKSCLYVNKLEDIDLDILRNLIKESFSFMTEKYG